MNLTRIVVIVVLAAAVISCDRNAAEPTLPSIQPVTSDLTNAWPKHGRTDDEQRFSPLSDINTETVNELELAWYFDVPTNRGMEATPIVIDDRMYVSGSWSMVYALDAATGKELWHYDPKVSKSWAQYMCCDAVNRGVAVWADSVFVGTLDGYLVSIDRATGKENWRVDTIDRKPPYTITGAPRIVDGMVFIGNGGADYGVRGYISAYDASNGELRWRFYTVPGNPANGFENEAMVSAAKTWTDEWWKFGGGGTVWDSMAYDAELDLLYFGVGNGSPWNQRVRSPGGGDNLFLASIVAVRPKTGEYVWHYQTTPGETWDYTATQHMVLADLEIDGKVRKVLMQAPKNGFFYVLDRTNGEFISAEAFAQVTWATGIDKETGRPIETPNARYADGPTVVAPSGWGGHNWHPMAFSTDTGLVYIPAQDVPFPYSEDPDFGHDQGYWNTAVDLELMHMPDDPAIVAEILKSMTGKLLAWDPVEQREVWRYQHAGPWNGGVLATAGNLVFQGSLIGEFAAYNASSGARVWSFAAQTGIAAAPVSYNVNKEQHIAVAAGWGTAFAMIAGGGMASMGMQNHSRILSFTLGGDAALPTPPPAVAAAIPEPPARTTDEAVLAIGKDFYYERCVFCHGGSGVSGGLVPDLRLSSAETHAAWDAIVLGGSLSDNGMPAFAQIFGKDQSDAIHAFVVDQAWSAYAKQ
jgi:PQQ-dependent dehydrogenase (methanol/ethanol family)